MTRPLLTLKNAEPVLQEETLKASQPPQQGATEKGEKGNIKPVPPLVQKLCERFPKSFNLKERKPLKVGIHNDILELLKDDSEMTPESLKKALRYYINGKTYQLNLTKHQHRYNLNGKKVEDVNPSHKAFAQAKLNNQKKNPLILDRNHHRGIALGYRDSPLVVI